MNSRYKPLYEAILALEQNNREPETINAIVNFPFPTMYPGQKEIIEKASKAETGCVIASHTGFGKSACFLTLTRGKPSLVIEPRKFLQSQLSEGYFNDFVLYGRSGYACPLSYAGTAASSYCLAKEDCSGTSYPQTCPDKSTACLNGTKDHKVFMVDGKYKTYPCEFCEYNNAVKQATMVLKAGGTVICNFGNFWPFVKLADIIVLDEADLFFKERSAPIALRFTKPKDGIVNIKELMEREVIGLKAVVQDKDPSLIYKATNALFNAGFFKANSELCFTYQKKDKIYVEVDPRNTNILKNKLFKGKQVIVVSATAGEFDLPAFSASIHQRAGIFFVPVGNMTSKNLKMNPFLMNSAAKTIKEISEYFEMVFDNKHTIIHAANLATHAASLFKILGEDDCTMHQSGKLAETINTYLESGKKYLIVASAEYGADFEFSKLQIGLKFPFPNLDERMNTLKRSMGPVAFSAYYAGEARTRTIQMAGRVSRGFNDFGVTILLDSKYLDDFVMNKQLYPEWYRERVNPRVF